MPKVSAVPGSPQSSTSTVNGSVVVPVDRITDAVPVNLACLLPGVAGQLVPGLLIANPSTDSALIRTPASLSLYSRLPLAGQHFATKPKLARPFGFAALTVRAGKERRRPAGENSGSSPGICPPPVALPGVFGGGGGAGQGAPGGVVSHGEKSTFWSGSMILSPVPDGFLGTSFGPDALPHQLFSAFRCGVSGSPRASTS